ncbi:hypothetical protein [Streptomyces acidiscabies]|uniref:Uncharacterized protein n=1 Tax=Streptomyces acidiscabies TaxID=42234 RepID=A0ABU4LYP2_9ACTN|nr:hypothetical protein [Streptomyces acidiscabies]MDX3020078.1 hypothetical protein [Streptomyces acidiscabies]
MSILIDTLVMAVRDSVTDAEATREDWVRAINLTFGQGAAPAERDPTAERDTAWLVSWEIDAEGGSPLGAARQVWADIFGRDGATDEDACVFTVIDNTTGQSVVIDLSDYEGRDAKSQVDDPL